MTRRLIEKFVSNQPVDREMAKRIGSLSDRESEVLRWVAKGLTNGEIGDRIFVSEATIKSHVSHILTKLVARDRAQAVAFAYEAGLLKAGSSEDDESLS